MIARVLLAVAFVGACPDLAIAQPAPQPAPLKDPASRARDLYTEGKRHYDLSDYPKAITMWRESYALSGAPMLLFNIGQAYRLSGNCVQALKFYASYEREAKTPANKEELELAKNRCNPSGDPTGANPPDPVIVPVADPPPVKPTVQPTQPDLTALRMQPDQPPPRGGGSLRLAGIVAASAGVVLVGTSFYFSRLASEREAAVEGFTGEWTSAQREIAENGESAGTKAVVFGVTGGLALIGGVTLYALGWRAGNESNVTVSVTPKSSEVQWLVRF